MLTIQETTEELLGNLHKKEKDEDDITVYSDDSFFDINNILNKSIEYGRSVVESPVRNYSLSPSKKPSNNFQDELFKLRNGASSNSSSPLKKQPKVQTTSNSHSTNNESTFDNDILKYLDMKMKPESINDSIFKISNDEEKTELIIKETHNLIKTVPASITSSKEGETYLELLSSSLSKLAKQLDVIKSENIQLKIDKDDSKLLRSQLEHMEGKHKAEKKENQLLKEKVIQLERKIKQKVPQQDSYMSRESNLLREKLVKYKKLYEDSNQENIDLKDKMKKYKTAESKESPNDEIGIEYQKKLVDLFNSLSALRDGKKIEFSHLEPVKQVKPTDEEKLQDEPNLKMLSLFEDLIQTMKKESRDAENIIGERKNPEPQFSNPYIDMRNRDYRESMDFQSRSEEYNDSNYYTPPKHSSPRRPGSIPSRGSMGVSDHNIAAKQTDGNLLNKVLLSLESNNELHAKLLQLLAEQTVDQADAKSKEERDIVLKCFMCQPQKIKQPKKCQRCSSINTDTTTSLSDDGKEKNETVNLMGEYKWTI